MNESAERFRPEGMAILEVPGLNLQGMHPCVERFISARRGAMTRDEFKDFLAVAMHVGRILHHIEKSNRKRGIPVFSPRSAVCERMDAGRSVLSCSGVSNVRHRV